MTNRAGSSGTAGSAAGQGMCQICAASLPQGAMFCGECGSSTSATLLTRRRPDPRAHDTTVIAPLPRSSVISVPVLLPPVPAPVLTSVALSVPTAPDAASTWASAPRPAEPRDEPADSALVEPARFILHFSTGEKVTVHGSGLLGRRPLPQPGESFDHLVHIRDSGMSVSKSHLEFGQHDGEFWVSDRFSGNGTVIHRVAESALRCESGRRYLVARGSRIDIADQFFLLT